MVYSNSSTALAVQDYPTILSFEEYKNRNQKKEDNIRYNLDGSIDRRKCNITAGQSSEVYAFRTKEEIANMIAVFDKHINEAKTDSKEQLARRNKLLFLIGMNVGIRGSDLRTLKWSFFFDKQDDGTLEFKSFYTLQPIKQKKHKKFVKLFFNQAVQKAINSYVSKYPFEDLDEYLFASQKGGEPIDVKTIWKIIKDTAYEADIKQNIGSHSLRKTWAFFCWHEAQDKDKALVILQQCFGHSSTQTTMRYIGLMDDEISKMYNSVNLGIEFI